MSTDLTVIEAPSLPSLLIEEDLDAAAEFLVAEKAGSTQAAYRSDYKIFVSYCTARGLAAMPAPVETVMGSCRPRPREAPRPQHWGAASLPFATPTRLQAMNRRRALKR